MLEGVDRGSEGDVVVVVIEDGVDVVGEEATGDGEKGEDGEEVDVDVEVFGNETSADALDFVATGLHRLLVQRLRDHR